MTRNIYNIRIKNIFLIILLSILFTVTALIISKPTSTYAAIGENNSIYSQGAYTDEGGYMDSTSSRTVTKTNLLHIESNNDDLQKFEANQTEGSGNDVVSYLYWNSTRKRSGVLIYIVDASGQQLAKQIYFDSLWYTQTHQNFISYFNCHNYVVQGSMIVAHAGDTTNSINVSRAKYLDNISTVGYSDSEGSYSIGSEVMSWLTEDSGDKLIDTDTGTEYLLPNWAELVKQSGYSDYLIMFLSASDEDQNQWHVFVEPVTACFIYKSETFTEDTPAPAWCGFEDNMWHEGDPIPAGEDRDGVWYPRVFIADSTSFLQLVYNNTSNVKGNSHTQWLLNKQLPFSLCLSEAVTYNKDSSYATASASSGYTETLEACEDTEARVLSYRPGETRYYIKQGIGIACLEIDAFKDPIHTYWESNGTPGDPEPTGDNSGGSGGGSGGGKSGTSKIYKHYYTVTTTYDSDGTTVKDLKVEKEDTRHEDNTTDFISVDDFTTAKELFIFLQFLRNMVYTCDC